MPIHPILKPLVKRGLFFSIEKGGFTPKMGMLDFWGNFTPYEPTYHQSTFLGAESAQPILTG